MAIALAVAALGGAIGAVWKSGWLAVGALSLSTSILLTWAFLGIFSIGLLIAVPALMMFVSLTQAFDGDSLGQRLLAAAALPGAMPFPRYTAPLLQYLDPTDFLGSSERFADSSSGLQSLGRRWLAPRPCPPRAKAGRFAASEIYLFSELSPLFIYRWSVA